MSSTKLFRDLIRTTGFWQDNALILQEMRYFPDIVALAILFPLLAALFEGFGIGFLLGFLQNLIGSGSEPFQTGVRWFDSWILGVDKGDLERLYRISALILLSTWLRACFNYLTEIYMQMAQARLVDRLYKQIFEQLQSLSLSFFSNTRSGEIVNTITIEVTHLRSATNAISFIVTKGSTLLVYTFIALWISWPLCLMAVALFSLAAVGLSTLNRRVREASFPVSAARGRFTSLASEFVNGIRTVKAFSNEDHERQRYYRASQDVMQTMIAAAKRLVIVKPLAEAIASTILISIIIVSMTLFVANGVMEVASLLTFLFILFRLVPAIQELNGSFARVSGFQGSIDNIKQLLRTDNKPYIQSGQRLLPKLKQAIDFVEVDFGYSPNSLVLRDITLTIEKGTTVALVGASGAGKSTLADLIPRFYDPTQGRILFDGVDLREFKISSVREKMAIVSQDTFIFNATVRENIAYGSSQASDNDVAEAAKLANAWDFIQKLPHGFETILGDRGVLLSGGQRQRIAIARALLRNPEILILDEATSALDSVSEKLIQSSIEELSVGRTTIVIAHRLSTIANADKVVVMEKGKIVEQGTYQELINKKGSLWAYHKMQNEKSYSSI